MNAVKTMLINDNKSILHIQEEFNALFPYLKIYFYVQEISLMGVPVTKQIKYLGKTLAECRMHQGSGSIQINPETTVLELDKSFRRIYGLGVQIFRKSGKVWLETTMTEAWTLDEQNRQGEALSA